MLVFERRPSWLELMLPMRSTVLGQIWHRVLVAGLVAAAVTVIRSLGYLPTQTITVHPFTLIGLALSIIIGFRNTTCYQRFHDGRVLWGRLVNRARSFAR